MLPKHLIRYVFPLILIEPESIFSNPANSGFFYGEYRIHAQQRSQWGSVSVPFTSTSLAMDMSLKGVGLGGQLLLDHAGTSSLFSYIAGESFVSSKINL